MTTLEWILVAAVVVVVIAVVLAIIDSELLVELGTELID